jgi:sulfite exporter TauE/SafE
MFGVGMGIESSYLAAFVVGLLGGVHCLGMCGGIVAALSLGMQTDPAAPRRQWRLQFGYNLGRITSYTVAGGIVGLLGMLALGLTGMQQARIVFQLVAALVMLALGLYLGGWWMGLTHIERAGSRWWKMIEPLGRRLIPVRTFGGAAMVGAIWGWLPCGLIYSVLIWALAAGDPLRGALLLLSFGLGTLPNLMLMGLFATSMSRFTRDPRIRKLAGLSVIMLGLWQAYLGLRLWIG